MFEDEFNKLKLNELIFSAICFVCILPMAVHVQPSLPLEILAIAGLIGGILAQRHTLTALRTGKARRDETTSMTEASASQLVLKVVIPSIAALAMGLLLIFNSQDWVEARLNYFAIIAVLMLIPLLQNACYIFLEWRNWKGLTPDAEN
ncbi:hypothetical protein KIM372_17050 [Bombiscardovia nodaiensis]|uniref:Uncharacterized protein n=1 Tax=Bombiscardovia nodaiensis TaxID=2932181 RepID=A0ABN6SDV9_9BIFI|nr:hypothetical protein KIM372_17050 [Bombiscardovia nodaiensis]